jgi:3-hydroxymyristoyl/3-hydroxydecanoyl-(acyl carrier protein) dehydratase
VLELAWADPHWAARLGDPARIAAVKFLAPVLPDATLTVTFSGAAGALRFEVFEGARLAASGAFEAPA